jgi:hypothetical protein
MKEISFLSMSTCKIQESSLMALLGCHFHPRYPALHRLAGGKLPKGKPGAVVRQGETMLGR